MFGKAGTETSPAFVFLSPRQSLCACATVPLQKMKARYKKTLRNAERYVSANETV